MSSVFTFSPISSPRSLILRAAFDSIIETIETLGVKVGDYLNDISAKQKTALTEFTTEFETAYASAKAKAEADWEAMYNELSGQTMG